MKTTASRSTKLSLRLNFDRKRDASRSLRAYALEILAGRERLGWSARELAEEAGVSMPTVYSHEKARVRSPQVRTMFSILFALGWERVEITKDQIEHKLRKVG